MDFTIKIYGRSTSLNGYKYEIIKDETGEIEHQGVANTAEEAEILSDRFLNEYITQPIKVIHRTLESG